MTRERDIDRILDDWFAERPTEAPDRVLDEVADRIGREPQQPVWLALWRDSHVNSYLKYAAAAAAVILVVALGFAVLRQPSGTDVGSGTATPSPSPSPSASPTPQPSASPTAGAVYPAWYTGDRGGAGILPAGNHAAQGFAPRFTLTVPEGWVNNIDEPVVYGLFPDTPANAAEDAASGGTANGIGVFRHASPFFRCDAWEDNTGTSAAEMVAALVANEALATSEPIDVAIGGLTGKQIDLQLDPAWKESCPGDPPGLDLHDSRTRLILLDSADRGLLVITIDSQRSADHEAFLAEAMPIIESFQFDVTP